MDLATEKDIPLIRELNTLKFGHQTSKEILSREQIGLHA